MATRRTIKVGHYTAQLIPVGRHQLAYIEITEDLAVVFKPDSGGNAGKCHACKVNKIKECREKVCPPIKKADPNASCADAITECVEQACKSSCGAGGGGGGILILD